GQALVRGGQRITAAVDDFADALVAADVVQGLLPLLGAQVVVAIGKVTAEAVAAVHRAAAADDQQQASVVFVDDPGAGIGVLFAEGVEYIIRVFQQLLTQRQHLSQQGVVGVAFVHALDKGLGHAQREI